jgi:hypothetical protein
MNKTLTAFLASTAIMFSTTNLEAAKQNTQVKKTVTKDWTIAIFLNADNNLDYFGVQDQKEMAKVGSNDYMNIVTLIDRERGPAQINYIEKDNIKKIKDMGELDMGDYKEFVKFVKFVKENYPAKHYCFNIWNHGSGWKDKRKDIVRGVSYDDSSNNHITTNQLSVALKEANQILGQKIDVLGFDACLMQMAEVLYACKDYAKYMIASEETEPGDGAPYDEILKDVKKGMTPADFADNWVGSYLTSYSELGENFQATTQSAVDLSKVDKLTDAINGFAKAVIAGNHAGIVGRAQAWSQHYAYYENIDLISLLDSMKTYLKDVKDPGLTTAIEKLRAAEKEAVISHGYTDEKLENSNGIAIFLPSGIGASVPSLYKELAFAKDTMWDEMIVEMGKRAIIEEVINDVKAGKTASFKKAVAQAKKEPTNTIYRSLLREMNYIYASENAVPAKNKAEVEKLLNDLKAAVKR